MQPLGENTVNTPAFLGKLWKMVNDPSTDHLICWSPSGTSFVIQNRAQFWYELLPLYYKHNNMSSFVRQLNMYGFHKMSTVDSGTLDADKDEIQFTHPFFVKGHSELLRNIKRKAAASKSTNENTNKNDDLTKVLSDVKQLRGRQATVDSQLTAIKQENALLWREVAILRQKHIKQQKIVNKLIQFLVTLVQPSRMTVGVKRGYQLMLNENPIKKTKGGTNNTKNHTNAEGPTIHELDSELDLGNNIYDDVPVVEGSNFEIENDMIASPTASVGSQQADLNSPLQSQLLDEETTDSVLLDKPDFVDVSDFVESDLTNDVLLLDPEQAPALKTTNGTKFDNQKVFLNPSAQDTLLTNLLKNNFTVKVVDKHKENEAIISDAVDPIVTLASWSPTSVTNTNMAIATCDKNLCDVVKSMPSTSDSYTSDLTTHIESTQTELEQFKDILNGYNSCADANALLGLFDGDSPTYDLNLYGDEENKVNLIDSADPLVSGSELAPYGTNFDFTELLDDSVDGHTTPPIVESASSTVNTPQITKEELLFPDFQRK